MSVPVHRSKQLPKQSHTVIPRGAHTYAKGDDQSPELAPGFIVRGKGCRVWDVDGNELIEYGMGFRSVTRGGCLPVARCSWEVTSTDPPRSNLNAPKSVSLLPNAEMVKFAKNGSDVNSAAVKLARACLCHPRPGTEPFAGISRAIFARYIKRGLLMPSLVVSYSHTDADIDRTISAISEALTVYARALAEGGVEKYLVGRLVKPVFRKYNQGVDGA